MPTPGRPRRGFAVLASPRRRRRVAIAVAVLVAGAAIAWAVVIVGNTAESPLPVTNGPVIVQHERRAVTLSARDRDEALSVARLFVRTAVSRNQAERAWPLASDALRAGTTLADWKAGTLPFAPFPVRGARWAMAYSVTGEIGLDVLVLSSDPETRSLAHRLTLVRSTRHRGPPWLVDSWTPESAAPGGFVEAGNGPVPFFSDASGATPSPGRIWVLAPLAVLLVALLAPVVMIVNSSRAERRTRRRRQASTGG